MKSLDQEAEPKTCGRPARVGELEMKRGVKSRCVNGKQQGPRGRDGKRGGTTRRG